MANYQKAKKAYVASRVVGMVSTLLFVLSCLLACFIFALA